MQTLIERYTALKQLLAHPVLDYSFWGNTAADYVEALVLFAALLAVFWFIQKVVLWRIAKAAKYTKTDLDDTIVRAIRSFRPRFYAFLAFYLALQTLALTSLAQQILTIIVIVWAGYQAIIAGSIFIDYFLVKKLGSDEDPTTQSALTLVGRIVKGALWGVVLLMVLSNLGVNVSSLLAGVGIGGVAIAFALQNILSDLFSSFSIYFDKPFRVGDFIQVGTNFGTVKHIGVKTTRLEALSGEELVISNQDLTSSRVQNYGILEERRIVNHFGLTYETPAEKLRQVPDWVAEQFSDFEDVRFDRCHFKEFGDSALGFELVFFMLTDDYNRYMDVQQLVNLRLKEQFEQQGVAFAYPTRTLYLHKSDVDSE
jgi:small-conductance mechanosensitive channel